LVVSSPNLASAGLGQNNENYYRVTATSDPSVIVAKNILFVAQIIFQERVATPKKNFGLAFPLPITIPS
jgi:hypothetical protein